MGFDIHTWYETVVEYVDPDTNEQRAHVEKSPERYTHYVNSEYVSPKEHKLDRMIREYGSHEATIDEEKLEQICSRENIPRSSIVRTTRRMNGWTLYK
jgi:hypothetical protein